jgi:hypothetical protein
MMVNAGQAAMADVLSALAGELAIAQSKCVRLDGALGQLLDTAPTEQRTAVMREMHVVDMLNQQIGAMAAFVERLSSVAPHGAAIEVGAALGAITLGEVAQRIGESVGFAGADTHAADEDVDFF